MEECLQAVVEASSSLRFFETEEAVKRALEAGVPRWNVVQTLLDSFHEALEKYEEGQFCIAHITAASSIFEMGYELVKLKVKPKGKVIIGTLGSSHYLGKDIIRLLFLADGFEVLDLGEIVLPEDVVEAVRREKPDIVALSVMILEFFPLPEGAIKLLEATGLRERAKVIVGGAVTSERWAKQIGADAWAPDGPGAIREVNRLLKGVQ
ncbi:cobalamin-dependent protein [Dehalococcoidia bacterium]|nr:cobalamin-dependent protein [Dehalococcoidia bacterium]